MSTTADTSSPDNAKTVRLFLTRGVIAITWAAVFVAASHSVTTEVTVGAGILVVLYPVIDLVASVIDAGGQVGSTRQWLLANAAVSTIAAIALGVAATGTVSDVFVVFGIWASLTGAAQLVVVLRRRAQLGKQWPLLLANGVSIIGGLAYIMASTGDNPKLDMLAIYAATGGTEFVIQAWLLARRRRRRGLTTVPAQS